MDWGWSEEDCLDYLGKLGLMQTGTLCQLQTLTDVFIGSIIPASSWMENEGVDFLTYASRSEDYDWAVRIIHTELTPDMENGRSTSSETHAWITDLEYETKHEWLLSEMEKAIQRSIYSSSS